MIRWKGKNIPSLYVLFYKLLKEKARNNIFIHYALAKETLAMKIYNIPRKYYYLILKEMEELGLLLKIGSGKKFRYEFVGKDIENLLIKEDLF